MNEGFLFHSKQYIVAIIDPTSSGLLLLLCLYANTFWLQRWRQRVLKGALSPYIYIDFLRFPDAAVCQHG